MVTMLTMISVVGLGQPPIPDNVGVPDASSDVSIAAEASDEFADDPGVHQEFAGFADIGIVCSIAGRNGNGADPDLGPGISEFTPASPPGHEGI